MALTLQLSAQLIKLLSDMKSRNMHDAYIDKGNLELLSDMKSRNMHDACIDKENLE
jgi:hypothetical protein